MAQIERQPNGSFTEIGGLKTYAVGASNQPKTAILFIYDGFGYQPQTLRGADLLAEKVQAPVMMPDFLDGGMPLDFEKQADTPEGKAYLASYTGRGGPAYGPTFIEKVKAYAEMLRKEYPTLATLGAVGLGYGGRVLVQACNQGAAIDCSAQPFPSHPSKDDAMALTQPHLILASGSESTEGVDAYEQHGAQVYRFPDMIHGWMGARGDLADPKVLEQFNQGYDLLAEFLLKHLRGNSQA